MRLRAIWCAIHLGIFLSASCSTNRAEDAAVKTTPGNDPAPAPAPAPDPGPVPAPDPKTSPVVPPPAFSKGDWVWENPRPNGNAISSFWVAGPDDVWAAGAAATVLHDDGTGWRRMPLEGDEDLHAIWGSSPCDIWAAGDAGAIHHFDGTQWSRVDAGTNATILSLRGTKADDVWAAGTGGTLLRFDGVRWNALPKPRDADLNAVWPFPGGDVWVNVGGQFFGPGEILHGDGTTWVSERQDGGTRYVLWADGPDDVWSVVQGTPTRAARWDGHGWTEMPMLPAQDCPPSLLGSFWGFAGHPWSICAGLGIARFDGSGWTLQRQLARGAYVIGGADPDRVRRSWKRARRDPDPRHRSHMRLERVVAEASDRKSVV